MCLIVTEKLKNLKKEKVKEWSTLYLCKFTILQNPSKLETTLEHGWIISCQLRYAFPKSIFFLKLNQFSLSPRNGDNDVTRRRARPLVGRLAAPARWVHSGPPLLLAPVLVDSCVGPLGVTRVVQTMNGNKVVMWCRIRFPFLCHEDVYVGVWRCLFT